MKKPEEATAAVKLAYEISTVGRPGPTLVDIPRDLQLAKASGEGRILVNVAKFKPPKPSESEIALATKIILEAERPVVLVGGGVLWSGATKEALELAERLSAPIVSTLPGKAAIPHNHPLYMPSGVKTKIYEYLTQNKGKEFTAEEIAKAIGADKVAIVKAQLTRLIREGKVEKTAEGKYRAK